MESCSNTPDWKDVDGDGCEWYEENEPAGCPRNGNHGEHDSSTGSANEHCCHCNQTTFSPTISALPSASPSTSLSPTLTADPTAFPTTSVQPTLSADPMASTAANPSVSPTLSVNPTDFCANTPNWRDEDGDGCDVYEQYYEVGCHIDGSLSEGDIGTADENCCHCNGGLRSCEDYRLKCQEYFSVLGVNGTVLTDLCEKAKSCPCDGEDDGFEIFVSPDRTRYVTDGLYNGCDCNYWLSLCEGTGGIACDHAAEYCCGDYFVSGGSNLRYYNSPICYCDFFLYAQNTFDYTLKTTALTMNEVLTPCNHFEEHWLRYSSDADDARDRADEISSLKTLYENSNGENWINNVGWTHNSDHCQWYGISCNSNRYVTGINLRNNNLTGQFPVYSRNGKDRFGEPVLDSYWLHTRFGIANLYYLETLVLADNKLTGNIDLRPLYNLKALHYFDISENHFSGDIDPLIAPSISHANFSNNNFTSMQRFKPYKISPLQSLRSLDVSSNNIRMNAADLFDNIPPNIEHFIASNNAFQGRLQSSLNNLPKLRRFDMSFNALSGELPVFENSRFILQELDVSNQDDAYGLGGLIPEGLWGLQFLKKLNLAGNKLTGSLPPDIVNMAVLRKFDVSNNLLSGDIPSQIVQLDGTLTHLGLANNTFSGTIPFQLGRLSDASVFLGGNNFDSNIHAPLSLCASFQVEAFDLADYESFCPMERTALSDVYDSVPRGLSGQIEQIGRMSMQVIAIGRVLHAKVIG